MASSEESSGVHVCEKLDPDIIKSVIFTLNSTFGNNLSDLRKADEFYKTCLAKKEELEKKLYSTNEDVTVGATNKIDQCENVLLSADKLSNKYDKVGKELKALLQEKVENESLTFKQKLNDVLQLEKYQCYLEWLTNFENISAELTDDIQKGRQQSAVFGFLELVDLWEKLKGTKCRNLHNYFKHSIVYWYDLLQEHIGSQFDKSLQNLNWPIVSTNSASVGTLSNEAIAKFEMLFGLLLQLQIPSGMRVMPEKESEELSDQLLPLRIMFRHFQKRFIFHFVKSKKTNRLDKPEWYFAQILTWIKDNFNFMEKRVQPLLEKAKRDGVYAKLELIRGLVHLACWKLKSDMPQIIFDDQTMTHAIDEILLFEKELQNQGYTYTQPSPIFILTSDTSFAKWLTLELKYAEERMDQIFTSENAWKCRYTVSDELDDFKVPEFAESFMTMLLLMTDRYRHLPDPMHQLEFLSLQLKLLDDFRVRLQQLRHAETEDPFKSHFGSIANTVHYLILVLKEWSNMPFFLQLYYTKQSLASKENGSILEASLMMTNENTVSESVFLPVLQLFEHMERDLLKKFNTWILYEIKAKSKPYRKEKWFSIVASEIEDLSASAYPMLKILKESLQNSEEILSKPLFIIVLHQMAKELSQYVFKEVILENIFSEGGAAQLEQDISRSIIPIFGAFMTRPDGYFKEVKEACVILTLPRGSSILLREVLEQGANRQDSLDALEEQSIYRLTPAQVLQVLNQRSDNMV